MSRHGHSFQLRIATEPDDLRSAQRLRYDVFVRELGGDGPLVDHDAGLEMDRYDPFFDHLVLIDPMREPGRHVVGVYRLLRQSGADKIGQYYSQDEYDISTLLRSGRRLLELGRSCVHPDYRGGTALYHLWTGLADYVRVHGIEILFGTASFHGTDTAQLALPLSYLHNFHLAPPGLRTHAHRQHYEPMDLIDAATIDRKTAVAAIPALIKAYIRAGGWVGEGAYIDTAFNTTDICLILDTATMNAKKRALYDRGPRG